ncbi:uncharacterized protein BDR25DRAFT_351245 [Lindgomyces ingoldianus]|uniref:Uncharacterized protein n=1 Tax=Lindgomyces ingoldianus TaxID=673940 RepID=A0ACB6R6B2_9PLEO|nr:uncharacterized protein BDR25DRAFT_351245 [Lindgomyces ingoldianus]KAF2474721.1 hypothetical protein BDR25DRAFT_351245 [Lindgomyces ingoldianus]
MQFYRYQRQHLIRTFQVLTSSGRVNSMIAISWLQFQAYNLFYVFTAPAMDEPLTVTAHRFRITVSALPPPVHKLHSQQTPLKNNTCHRSLSKARFSNRREDMTTVENMAGAKANIFPFPRRLQGFRDDIYDVLWKLTPRILTCHYRYSFKFLKVTKQLLEEAMKPFRYNSDAGPVRLLPQWLRFGIPPPSTWDRLTVKIKSFPSSTRKELLKDHVQSASLALCLTKFPSDFSACAMDLAALELRGSLISLTQAYGSGQIPIRHNVSQAKHFHGGQISSSLIFDTGSIRKQNPKVSWTNEYVLALYQLEKSVVIYLLNITRPQPLTFLPGTKLNPCYPDYTQLDDIDKYTKSDLPYSETYEPCLQQNERLNVQTMRHINEETANSPQGHLTERNQNPAVSTSTTSTRASRYYIQTPRNYNPSSLMACFAPYRR